MYDHCAGAFSCEIATYKGSGKKFFEVIADPHTLDVCDHVMLGRIPVVNIHHAIFQPQRLAHLLRNSSARSNVDRPVNRAIYNAVTARVVAADHLKCVIAPPLSMRFIIPLLTPQVDARTPNYSKDLRSD